jgi:PAS domain-containing protein
MSMKVEPGLRARVRELARLRSRATRVLSADSGDGKTELLNEALALCEALIEDVRGADEQSDAASHRVAAAETSWDYLFERMPQACVCTDVNGVVMKANEAAGSVLNIAPSRLDARLLMHFTDSREQFAGMLRAAAWDRVAAQATITIRPRERAPIAVDALAMTRTEDDNNIILWFLSPVTDNERSTAAPRGPRHRLTRGHADS